MKRIFLLASLLLAALPALGQGKATQDRTVNVFNWSDYIDPTVLDDFTSETGIRVVYDTYDNNEIVEAKLLAGQSGYDVVVPSGPFLQRLIKAGVFLKLDPARLPNAKNLWPDILKRQAAFDPGNQFSVPYMWGTTGLGLNVKKVRERLGPDVPLNSWDLLLKPATVARLKGCGVTVLDAPEDVFPSTLRAIGLDPNTRALPDLQKAADALAKIRGSVQKFHSSEYINGLAGGDVCLALGYSGDVIQAKKRAEEAKNGVEIAYVVPKEGALMWFDSLAVPKDAPHPDAALAFIDFLQRPEIAARNSNVVAYANGNLAARPLVKPEVLNDPGVYPDEATFARLFTNSAYDDKLQTQVTRLWTRVKTGR